MYSNTTYTCPSSVARGPSIIETEGEYGTTVERRYRVIVARNGKFFSPNNLVIGVTRRRRKIVNHLVTRAVVPATFAPVRFCFRRTYAADKHTPRLSLSVRCAPTNDENRFPIAERRQLRSYRSRVMFPVVILRVMGILLVVESRRSAVHAPVVVTCGGPPSRKNVRTAGRSRVHKNAYNTLYFCSRDGNVTTVSFSARSARETFINALLAYKLL